MERLPIFLSLQNRPCLVVGGGIIAERKVRLLLRSGAAVTVVSPVITDHMQGQVERGEISHLKQPFSVSLAKEFWLTIAATDDMTVNHDVAAATEAAGRLCNVVDDEAASSFVLPAIIDRSPVVIAIGTNGNAPVLAQQLKTRIEAWLPARIGILAEKAGRWRKLVKKRFTSLKDRRRFWQAFFAGPIAEHILAGRDAAAENAVRAELIGTGASTTRNSGVAWIVGAGPGDPGLVTLRAQQLISQADTILYDRLVSPQILDFARKEADLVYVGKHPGSKAFSQETINRLLVERVAGGERVCRLKGGDPFVFGRGAEEVLALAERKLPYEIVPGITAAVGCAAYAGVPLTMRGTSASVTLTTARLDNDIGPDWSELLKTGHTLAIYMGVGAIEDISKHLLRSDVAGNLPVAIVENGTTGKQRTVLSTAASVLQDARRERVRSPAMLFIGKSVGLSKDLQWIDEQEALPGATVPAQSA